MKSSCSITMYILSLCIFIGIFILPSFYSYQDVVLERDGTAIMIKKTWWGFKEEDILLKSMGGKWYYFDKKNSTWEEMNFYEGDEYDDSQEMEFVR